MTITDDDVPAVTVSFGQSAYTVAEGSSRTVTVELSADPERTVIIPIVTTNQGGAAAADYSGVPQSVTFDSGDISRTFTFTAEADNVNDDGESVRLSFGASLPADVTAGTPGTSIVTITDDDVPAVTVSFGAAWRRAARLRRGGGLLPHRHRGAERGPGADGNHPHRDHQPGRGGGGRLLRRAASVTFTSGDTSRTFTFTAEADDDNDDGESVRLSFGASLPADVTAGTPGTSIVTITDDDVPAVTVSFGQSAYTVAEGSSRTVTVELSADPERTVVIPIETANQGGASAADYSGVPQTVTFNAGDTSRTFTFTAEADTDNDDGESVRLSFGAGLPAGVTAGTPNTATVSITDDDVPAVTAQFGQSAYTVAEGGTQTVTVILSADPERTVIIPIVTTNQDGAAAADYSGVPGSVTFTSGDTSMTFTFTAEDDDDNDDDESVRLSFGASLPADVTAGTPDQATVSITDDDVPAVTAQFGQSAYTVAEGSSRTVTVELSADPERTVIIPIVTTNQGGATNADYSGVPGSVTFTSGDTSRTFTFTAEADNVNDDGESVRLSFGASLPADVTAGTPATSIVTITDDDVPAVTAQFGQSAYTVAEGGAQTVTVTLSADPERTVVIPIEKTDQNGATAADYSGVPPSVTFDSGDTAMTFTFTAEADDVNDDDESVRLSFGASLPADVTAGTPDQATVSITDDDVPAVTVSFGAASYAVAEGSSRTVTVELSADPERTVVIPIVTTNQGGAAAADYSGVPQSVTFDSGDTSRTFTFTAEDDTVAEGGAATPSTTTERASG